VSKFLVTGGAGFIGSHLTKRLLNQKHEVVVIDNLSKGFKSNIPDGVKFYNFDLVEFPKFLVDTGHKFDCVFHLAGQSSGERSVKNPIEDLRRNLLSTYSIVKLIQTLKIPKLIFSSSMAIYGEQGKQPVTESMLPNPLTPYGVHKVASEQILKIACQNLQNSVTILRLFNVYGPGQELRDKHQGMLSIYLSYLLENKPIIVRGSLERVRDFIYIDDVIDAMERVSEVNTPGFEILNVCTGVGTQIYDLIDKLHSHINASNSKITRIDGTPGDQFKIYGSPDLIKSKYNWNSLVSLDKGLEKLSKYNIDNFKSIS